MYTKVVTFIYAEVMNTTFLVGYVALCVMLLCPIHINDTVLMQTF